MILSLKKNFWKSLKNKDYDIVLIVAHSGVSKVFSGYFEGIKDSFQDGIVDVKVKGKNLFDTTKLITSSNSNVSIVALKDKFLLHGVINNS